MISVETLNIIFTTHFWKEAQSWLQKRNGRISVANWDMDLKITFTTSPSQLVNSL